LSMDALERRGTRSLAFFGAWCPRRGL